MKVISGEYFKSDLQRSTPRAYINRNNELMRDLVIIVTIVVQEPADAQNTYYFLFSTLQ